MRCVGTLLWSGKGLMFHCDDEAAVLVWQNGSCRNKNAMHSIRFLLAQAASGNFILFLRHIAGVDNCIADALSRLQITRFQELAPTVSQCPVPTPPLNSLL